VGGPPIIATLIELSRECSACGHVGKSLEQLSAGGVQGRPDLGGIGPKKTVSRKMKQLPAGKFVRYVGKVV